LFGVALAIRHRQ